MLDRNMPKPFLFDEHRPALLLSLVLCLVSLLQYSHTMQSPILWDSKTILEDSKIHDLANIPSFFFESSAPERAEMGMGAGERLLFFRPVMKSVLAIEYALWGASSVGYHCASVFLNCVVVVLFFFLVWRLSKRPDIALWSALLYAVNPAHGEAVNWIYSASSLWMALFVLMAFHLHLSNRIVWATFLYSLGFLSRESAIFLLPILFIYEFTFCCNDTWTARSRKLFPIMVTGGVLLLARCAIVDLPYGLSMSIGGYFNTVTLAVARLLKIMVVPDAAVAHYLLKNVPSSTLSVSLSYLVVLGCVLLAVFFWLKNRRLFFWFSWGFIWLALVLNVGGGGQYWFAEKVLYLASGGFCVVVVTLLLQWRAWTKWMIGIAVLIHFATTLWRSTYWLDETEHLRAVLAFSPNYSMARYTLATGLAKQGNCSAAVAEFKQVLREVPGNPLALNNLALCYYNLGQGGPAEKAWQDAYSLDPTSPNPALNLGLLAEKQGRDLDALKFFRGYLERTKQPNPQIYKKIDILEKRIKGETD